MGTGECEGSRASLRGKMWPEDLSHASSPVTRVCHVLLAGVSSSLCKTVDPDAKYALGLPPPSAKCDQRGPWRTPKGPACDWEALGSHQGLGCFVGSALAGPPTRAELRFRTRRGLQHLGLFTKSSARHQTFLASSKQLHRSRGQARLVFDESSRVSTVRHRRPPVLL